MSDAPNEAAKRAAAKKVAAEQQLQKARQRQLGEAVRRVREEQTVEHERGDRTLSQEALAAKAGLHRNYLGRIERGEINASFLNLNRIADALGVQLAELLQDQPRPKPKR